MTTTMLKANDLINKTINVIRKKDSLYHINIHNVDYSYDKTTDIYNVVYFSCSKIINAKFEYTYYVLFSEEKESYIEINLNFETFINYKDFFDIKVYITDVEIKQNKLKIIGSKTTPSFDKIIEINTSNNFYFEQISRHMFDAIIHHHQ